MTNDSKAIACACVAVLSWSTVATAFKMALRYLTHFEMLWAASLTSLVIFAVLLTAQRKWRLLGNLTVETMVVLCRTGTAESGGLLLGAVQGIRFASCAGGAAY